LLPKAWCLLGAGQPPKPSAHQLICSSHKKRPVLHGAPGPCPHQVTSMSTWSGVVSSSSGSLALYSTFVHAQIVGAGVPPAQVVGYRWTGPLQLLPHCPPSTQPRRGEGSPSQYRPSHLEYEAALPETAFVIDLVSNPFSSGERIEEESLTSASLGPKLGQVIQT
jgi:hypothetical protein